MILMLNLQYNQYLGVPVTPDTGDAGEYFETRFKALGGFTPEISKALGW
jgi:hypothetical protein